MIGIIYINQSKEELDNEIDHAISLGLDNIKIFVESGAIDFEFNIDVKLKYTFAKKENADSYFNEVDYYRGIPITYHFIENQKSLIKEVGLDDIAKKFGIDARYLRIKSM